MEYMKLDPAGRGELLAALEAMPRYLEMTFAGLDADDAARPGPDGLFSPVEQAWHLADLEREGFGVRIDRLLREESPQLPDFDGTAVALARDYRHLSLADGLASFASARRENLRKLRAVPADAWTRGGTQEGVGAVSLCDMPSFLRQHDLAHRDEIERWRRCILVPWDG